MTPGDRPLVCVLVDAFRHDYLRPERAPYLAGLADELGWARMRPILGYSDSIRATIFTGLYPVEHGYWMEYCYRPESSPFADLARLAPLERIPNDFVRRGLKFTLSQTVVRRRAARLGYAHLSLRHLPFRGLPVFDWTLRASMQSPAIFPVPTIFDRLTEAGLPWTYLDSTHYRRRSALLADVEALPRDTRLAFVYLHYIDMASHTVGLDSRLFDRSVRRTDEFTKAVVERARARLGDVDVLVFSDHGMSAVRELHGYRELWRHPGFPSQFVFALDATMVRLWDADEDVREIVRRGAPGRFLTDAERSALHIDFSSRLYGDEIYLLEPGAAIFPNFHSMLKPKAMHAYHPDDPDQHGIFITSAGGTDGGMVELVDVAPTIERALGLSAPATPRR